MKKQNKKEQCESTGTGKMIYLIISRIYNVCKGNKSGSAAYREKIIISTIVVVPAFIYFIVNIFNLNHKDVLNFTVFSGVVSLCVGMYLLKIVIEQNNLSLTEALLRVSAITFFIVTSAFSMFAINEYFIQPTDNYKNGDVQNTILKEKYSLNTKSSGSISSQAVSSKKITVDIKQDTDKILSNEEILALVALIGTFAGALSYIFKVVVRNDLLSSVNRENEKQRLYIRAFSCRSAANDHYILADEGCEGNVICQRNFKKALEWFKKALEYTGELCHKSEYNKDSIDVKQEYFLLLCAINNNIAWVEYKIYKEKYSGGEKERKKHKINAMRHIEFTMNQVDKFNFPIEKINNWQETKNRIDEWEV